MKGAVGSRGHVDVVSVQRLQHNFSGKQIGQQFLAGQFAGALKELGAGFQVA